MSESTWWGRHELQTQATAFFHIGPMRMWVTRDAAEWRVAWDRSGTPMEDTLVVRQPADEAPPENATVNRFGLRKTESDFFLLPALADRAYVVNPEPTFSLPPGEKTRLYVSTPLMIRFQLREAKDPLWEAPSVRSSLTWFGPSTRQGEVCYASRTRAMTSLEGQPAPPHRAVSVVNVENKAQTLLPLENLRLPMPSFSIYASRGRLWTQTATLIRGEDDELAELRLERNPPKEAGEAKMLAGPREIVEKKQLVRAFGGIFR